VLRLLDRALVAHGRDAGYTVDAWHEYAGIDAFTRQPRLKTRVKRSCGQLATSPTRDRASRDLILR
jgi:hypothetical protein